MGDTKWADVAHYYLRSGIKCNVYRGDLTERRGDCKHTVETFGIKHLRVAADSMTFGCVPILRHRDDMTEAEDNECMLVHTRWISNEEFKNVIWSLTKQHKTFDQYSTHWLISHGFDVFGLIESGQAIRKEVGNA
jgi:hypothetical protein